MFERNRIISNNPIVSIPKYGILCFTLLVILMCPMNFVKTPKTRVYDNELEQKAIEFHGNGGPFMIVGLRMGLSALNHFDTKGWFGLECVVKLKWAPPDCCVIDGFRVVQDVRWENGT